MPHLIVKVADYHSEAEIQALGERLTTAVTQALNVGPDTLSIAIEEVPLSEWTDRVYVPEIEPQLDRLLKRPGYGRPTPEN
jgi:4-oxalocrotonate tautomerase